MIFIILFYNFFLFPHGVLKMGILLTVQFGVFQLRYLFMVYFFYF